MMTKPKTASKSPLPQLPNSPDRVSHAGNVYLRALCESDLERIHRWHNDPKLYENFPTPFRYVSLATEREWLQKKMAASTDSVNLAICLSPGDEHIGNIYLTEIDWISRNASIGMFLANTANRRKGYGADALSQLLSYAFNELNLMRVYLHTFAKNISAIKIAEKAGFTLEGQMRNHVFKNGRYEDVLVMALSAEEFRGHDAIG